MTIMIKFLFLAILASLAVSVRADDSNSGGTVALQYLNHDYGFFRMLFDASCVIKDFLSDPEVNSRLYSIRDSIPDVFAEVRTCAEPLIFAAMNDRESGISRFTTIFRLGNTGEIKRWEDVLPYFPAIPGAFWYLIIMDSFRSRDDKIYRLGGDVEHLWEDVSQKCGSSVQKWKSNFEFLGKRFEEIVTKYDREFRNRPQ